MKTIQLLFLLLIFFSCSRSNEDILNPTILPDKPSIVDIAPEIPEDISLQARREYAPNFWQSLEFNAKTDGRYKIPERLEVSLGNSARGWASLRIADRVFCYRGNASSSSSLDGDAYILWREKSDVSKECNHGASSIMAVAYASINKDDRIRLHISGGGCNVAAGACVDTEIEGSIILSEEFLNTEPVLELLSYPEIGKLEFDGVLIANLNTNSTRNTIYGSVKKGRTLNYVNLLGREFLILGEDGISSAECETDVNYPSHGPTHERCQTVGAESFDKIIICAATDINTTVRYAQEWNGLDNFMTNSRKGMECWVDGVKLKSSKIFVY